MDLQSISGNIMCLPFTKREEKAANPNKLCGISAYTTLAPLKAVSSVWATINGVEVYIQANQNIYVRGDRVNVPWAKERLKIDGLNDNEGKQIEFILVPLTEVLAVETEKVTYG